MTVIDKAAPAAASSAPESTPSHGAGSRWRRRAVYLPLVLIAVAFLIPLIWLLSISLNDDAGLASGQLIPKSLHWKNFTDALTLIPFGRYAATSLLLAGMHSILATLSSALVGFGFARLRARGKGVLFMIVIATMMVPAIVTLIPTYLIFARIGLVYTYWPWVLWGLGGSAFLIFLFRQAFSAMPSDLEDAAIIDGCGWLRMFFSVFLPLAKAPCLAGFILTFTGGWADFISPSLFLSSDQTTLAVGLSQGYVTPAGTPLYTTLAAGAILYILPVLVIFLVLQRGFVNGFVTSGMK